MNEMVAISQTTYSNVFLKTKTTIQISLAFIADGLSNWQ